MNDKERYIDFLKSIGFQETENMFHNDIYCVPDNCFIIDGNSVYLGQGEGYSGFFSWLEFDKDGKFIKYGAGE